MTSHDRTLAMMLENMLASYSAKRRNGTDHATATVEVLDASCAGPKTKAAFRAATELQELTTHYSESRAAWIARYGSEDGFDAWFTLWITSWSGVGGTPDRKDK